MQVAIIGGGLGGMATAVRLAKMGHEVTLLEATDQLGGAIGTVHKGDFAWDTGPNSTLLPAVLRDLFRKAASTAPLKGVMSVLEDEWASSRIVGDPHSSIIDLPLTQVMGDNLVSIAAWYDNEMGYATRLADMAAYLTK